MATRTSTTDACRRPYRFSVKQLERMIETGVVSDSKNLELIRGRLYLTTKHEPHNYSVMQIADLLRQLFPREGFNVREEKAMSHDRRSMPEPDVAVVRGSRGVFRPRPPFTSEAVLIVEVCNSTKRADYDDKLSLYAEAGAPTYWIIDIDDRKLAVHTEPTGDGRRSVFARVETFAGDAAVPVVLDGREVGRIAVKDVLPPSS